MRVFISAGEPSGDLHGANLIRSLFELDASTECIGFGGEKMEAAGARLLYPLCQLAVMGFVRVVRHAPVFVQQLIRADRYFRTERPDAVVLIDYPGFNWWVARRAHAHGIPVFYFVPPQIWAWASWRVEKMRRWVDHVLCSLPFEEPWYRERGVPAQYVGHPYFDELPRQQLHQGFLADQRARPGRIIGLLPGSRSQEIRHNLATLERSAALIHRDQPDTRFLVACFKEDHLRRVQAFLKSQNLPFIEPHVGRTAEIIELAHSCVAVSGSVSLELLYRNRPSVVVYRSDVVHLAIGRRMKKCKYISLVNLLADEELYPEYLSTRCEADSVSRHILRWLEDAAAYDRLRSQLAALKGKIAEPGACSRAARCLMDAVSSAPSVGKRAA